MLDEVTIRESVLRRSFAFERFGAQRDAVVAHSRELVVFFEGDGTIALARALGLTVIAVGIETDAERVDMREAGCDYGQGSFFGSAQPAGSID